MSVRYTQVKAFQGPDASGLFLPRLDLDGTAPGPHLWLTACVHGDEVNGIEVIHRVMDAMRTVPLRGRISAFPVVNVTGLVAQRRHERWDDSDLNRCFPGDAHGTGAQRLADAVYSTIKRERPAVAIDLHTDSVASIPYVILDRATHAQGMGQAGGEAAAGRDGAARSALREAHRLAKSTGLAVVSDYPLALYRRHALDRSLSGSLINRAHIPAMTIELGPTRVMDPSHIAHGVTAVCAVMGRLGMIDRAGRARAPRLSASPLTRVPGPRASVCGVIRFQVRAAQKVRRGQVIAQLRDFSGALLEEVRSPSDGWVISLPERAFATPGLMMATVATTDRS